MIYYKVEDENGMMTLESRSLVFMSGDLKHDYYFLYKVIQQTMKHIADNIAINAIKIYYVSDGCPNQYKNVHNFQTVCFHKSDFGVPCEWIFFATRHGKSPCDGLGGTTKRLTTRASLQRTIDNQITCAKEMLTFRSSEIDGITFYYIEKDDQVSLCEEGSPLSDRFNPEKLYYLPGTKSMHHFVPISSEETGVKRVSTDVDFEFIFNFKTGAFYQKDVEKETFSEIVISGGEFIVCKNDDKMWIGVVTTVHEAEKDCLARFMHPPIPSRSFVWPAPRVDECNNPFKILLTIKAPNTTSGRSYSLHPDDVQNVNGLLI